MLKFLYSLGKYLIPQRGLAAVLVFGILAEAGFESALRFSFKFLIDQAIVPQDTAMLFQILTLLGCGALILIGIALLSDVLWAKLSGLVINQIRLDLFEHIHGLSMEFFARRSNGDILNRFLSDMSAIENTLVNALYSGLLALSSIVFSGGLLFSINQRLAFLSCLGVLICILAPQTLIQKATAAGYMARQKEGEIANSIQESIVGQAVIRVFKLELYMTQNLKVQLDGLLSQQIQANKLNYISQRIPTLLFITLNLITLGLVGYQAIQGQMSVGDLISYQVLFLSLSNTVYNISWVIPNLIDGMAGLQRVENVLQEKATVSDQATAIDLPPFQKTIEFDQVSFDYAENRMGLKEVSFSIRKGEFVSLVGLSGSGKSTVINLLLRFYDPSAGRILIDQMELTQATQSSLHNQIGLVSQDVMLFNCSIRENIRLGQLKASDAQIEAAAIAAEIHDVIISLPQGYETIVGDRGNQLSGGQRQRIALARALVRDPAILILDEATSSLDPLSEASILSTLEQVAKNRTVISVTHRLSQTIRADVIFVFQAGTLIESGHHDDLVQQKGLYNELWNSAITIPQNNLLKVSHRESLIN